MFRSTRNVGKFITDRFVKVSERSETSKTFLSGIFDQFWELPTICTQPFSPFGGRGPNFKKLHRARQRSDRAKNFSTDTVNLSSIGEKYEMDRSGPQKSRKTV